MKYMVFRMNKSRVEAMQSLLGRVTGTNGYSIPVHDGDDDECEIYYWLTEDELSKINDAIEQSFGLQMMKIGERDE